MARYIDADAAIKAFEKLHGDEDSLLNVYNADWIVSFIESQPTADVQAVRHGVWHIMSEDPFDETNAPTERGYYRVIDYRGEEHMNFFFGKPIMTGNGVVWWADNDYVIRAWAKIDGGEA